MAVFLATNLLNRFLSPSPLSSFGSFDHRFGLSGVSKRPHPQQQLAAVAIARARLRRLRPPAVSGIALPCRSTCSAFSRRVLNCCVTSYPSVGPQVVVSRRVRIVSGLQWSISVTHRQVCRALPAGRRRPHGPDGPEGRQSYHCSMPTSLDAQVARGVGQRLAEEAAAGPRPRRHLGSVEARRCCRAARAHARAR